MKIMPLAMLTGVSAERQELSKRHLAFMLPSLASLVVTY